MPISYNVIKSILRILISVYIVYACVQQDNKENIYKVYEKLNENEFKDLMGWSVFNRGREIIMIMYYDHLDSSKYEYYKSGKVHPFTRYASIGFTINNNFDSLYYLGNDATMHLKSGLFLLSKLSGKSVLELDKEIRSNFVFYEKYDLPQIAGYPWGNSYIFTIDQESSLYMIEDAIDSLYYIDSGLISINSNWWYRIEKSE